MSSHYGKRQAVRRATSGGTLVSCESCGRVEVVRLPVSKAVDSLGWWRDEHDLVLCDGCYVPGENKCDRCGCDVPNGEGHYLDGDESRVCGGCRDAC